MLPPESADKYGTCHRRHRLDKTMENPLPQPLHLPADVQVSRRAMT